MNLQINFKKKIMPRNLPIAVIPEAREKRIETQDIARAPLYRLARFFWLSLSSMREAEKEQ